VAIVFITADSGEEYIVVEKNTGDRNDLEAWHSGADLVKAVAGVNKNTIVVVNTVGPILLEAFADLPNVKAIVWAGLPGEEAGNALVDVLYGSVSPSGKLPYTIAKSAADYGTMIQTGSDTFSEGVFIDYRHFDKSNIAPRYEFGFGLCESPLLNPTAASEWALLMRRSVYDVQLQQYLHHRVSYIWGRIWDHCSRWLFLAL